MSRIIDISVPLYSGMVFYPGDKEPSIEPGKQIANGDTANLSEIRLGSHSGTHVDAPHHFIDGEGKVDQMSLQSLVGPARVLDLTATKDSISGEDLRSAGIEGAERILLKTRNSELWRSPVFEKWYVSLANGGADYLVEKGIRLVGIDYLSIEEFHSETCYVHRRLLKAGIIILEGIDLSVAGPGDYQLVCLPLKIRDGDGAPARAVLVDDRV